MRSDLFLLRTRYHTDIYLLQVQKGLASGYRMPCPIHCSPDLYRVMTCCWEEIATDRPTFTQLVDKMTQLLEQANQMLDIRRIQENDDYVNHLPPQNQELFLDYAKSEMLC